MNKQEGGVECSQTRLVGAQFVEGDCKFHEMAKNKKECELEGDWDSN